jgi:hypothetical protein
MGAAGRALSHSSKPSRRLRQEEAVRVHKGALPRRCTPKERCSPIERVRLRSGVIAPLPRAPRDGRRDRRAGVLEDRDRDLHDREPEELDNRRERPEHAHGTGARRGAAKLGHALDHRTYRVSAVYGGAVSESGSTTCPICGKGTLRTVATSGISSPIAVRCKPSRAATRSKAAACGPPTPIGSTWSAVSRRRR